MRPDPAKIETPVPQDIIAALGSLLHEPNPESAFDDQTRNRLLRDDLAHPMTIPAGTFARSSALLRITESGRQLVHARTLLPHR